MMRIPDYEKHLAKWKLYRQMARTDLQKMCQVLGYNDVSRRIHGPVLDSMQQFQGGEDVGDQPKMNLSTWKPAVPNFWELKGPRRRLVLIPRGHLKSTICTIAHTIQWLVNYPDIRILLSTATGEQATKFLAEIKGHFQINSFFRMLYPEFCPPAKKAKEWGTQESFTLPCRSRSIKEPSVSICTVGKVVAGGHYDVIKNDDLVDKENVRTPDQIANVNSHFGFINPLLETSAIAPHTGWIDVIGTRYDYADLYGTIIDSEKEKPEAERQWQITIRSAAPNYPEGPVMWPERVPLERLREIERDPTQGLALLSSQYLMNPIPGKSGLVESEKDIIWVPEDVIGKLYAGLSLHATVDLCGMEEGRKGSDNDFTVINLHGFGHDGTLYVLEVIRHQAGPEQVIEDLFSLAERHPRLIDIKVSKDHMARVLLPFVKREQIRRQKFLPIYGVPIDNRVSKVQKIRGLQPWFRNGSVKFSKKIVCAFQVTQEIMRFPKYNHDDILDTIADAMLNREGEVVGDVHPRERKQPELPPVPFEAQSITPEVFWGKEDEDFTGHDPITGW